MISSGQGSAGTMLAVVVVIDLCFSIVNIVIMNNVVLKKNVAFPTSYCCTIV